MVRDQNTVIKGGYFDAASKPAQPIMTSGKWGTPIPASSSNQRNDQSTHNVPASSSASKNER